jgi:exo-beta-1,3-glucanase (GH17 family)
MARKSWHRSFKVVSLLIVCVVLASASLQYSVAEILDSQKTISAYGAIQVVHTTTIIVGVDVWCGTTANKFLSEGHLSLMQECGIQMVRLEFDNDSVANLRTLVPVVVQNGIEVLGLLLRTDLAPDNVDAWGDWVYSVVNEFKQYVHVWEIWNEPNLENYFPGKDPVKYTNFLKRGYTEAKRADPTCKVLGGSIAFTHQNARNFLEAIYQNGGKDYMDALSYHPYVDGWRSPDEEGGNNPYPWLASKVRPLMANYGDTRPIWITEFGYPTGDIGEQLQADYLVQALEMARDWGWVETFIIYNWQDGGGFTFGLTKSNGTPKPSFYAVKSFAA